MKDIETGVDKLVSLVERKKKISLDDAAKELGVGHVVIQEWADFLEEQGVLSVEYSLSKVWLTVKTLTKHEVAKKVKEYDTKRDNFVRKVETSLNSLEKEFHGFEKIKDEFEKIKSGFGMDLDKVEKELAELKKYETVKQKIDDDILKQKAEYQKILDGSQEQVDVEKKRFEEILKGIEMEKSKLELEKKEFATLEDNEANLKKRLEALNDIISTVEKKIGEQEKEIESSESRIDEFKKIAENMMKEIDARKNQRIAPLTKLSEEQKKKIAYIQDQIVAKVEDAKKRIEKNESSAREVAQRFKSFFDRKAEIEKLVNQIEEDRNMLHAELESLKKKAITFNLISKNADIKGYVADLEKNFTKLDKRKYLFRKELEKLVTLVNK